MSVAAPTLRSLAIAGDPGAWARIGFELDDGRFAVGSVTITVAPDGGASGITGWGLSDFPDGDLDGLATENVDTSPTAPASHPNGARVIDHVVVLTPSLQRTASVLEGAGMRLRRERTGGSPEAPVRQGFFRMGEVILEVVSPVNDGGTAAGDPARFWGMVFVVDDLDALGARLGERLGAQRDAVQPGRRIATVRSGAGLGVPVAFMTPHARD